MWHQIANKTRGKYATIKLAYEIDSLNAAAMIAA